MQRTVSRGRHAWKQRRNAYWRATHLPAAILASLFAVSDAIAEPWGNLYDALLERPGVEVSSGQQEDGTDWRSFKTPAGIEISQTRRGDLIETFSIDRSGHGAVLCLRDIVVATKLLAEFCPQLSNPTADARLETALDRIHRFIQENALQAVTLEDLDQSIQRRRESGQQDLAEVEDKAAACQKSDFADLVRAFGDASNERFEKGLEKTLSVPRIPVLNPCL